MGSIYGYHIIYQWVLVISMVANQLLTILITLLPSFVPFRCQEYKRDNTGGPRGQLAAHPAAAQFVIDNAAPWSAAEWGRWTSKYSDIYIYIQCGAPLWL